MKISKKLLNNLIELSKNAYPNEVGGIILGKPVINDFVLFPGEFSRYSISLNLFNLPIYANLMGTFHSHPSNILRPSNADLKMFGKIGLVHIILGIDSFKFFSPKGEEIKLVLSD